MRVEDQGPERLLNPSSRRRDACDDRLQQIDDAGAVLCRDSQRLRLGNAYYLLDMPTDSFGLCVGQIDLIYDRNYHEIVFERQR